jgi:hypothetical protein
MQRLAEELTPRGERYADARRWSPPKLRELVSEPRELIG